MQPVMSVKFTLEKAQRAVTPEQTKASTSEFIAHIKPTKPAKIETSRRVLA